MSPVRDRERICSWGGLVPKPESDSKAKPYCPSVTARAVVTLIGPAVEPGDVITLKRRNRCSKREENLSGLVLR